jgi:peroxiredoxin
VRASSNPKAVEIIAGANERLQRSGEAPGLELGERAPLFTLPDATRAPVSLEDLLERGPVVISFYRGEWCPYCNVALRAMQQVLPEIRELGASLVAISPQRPDDALTMQEKHALEFHVLSDVEQEAAAAYRVRFRVPSEIERVHMDIWNKDISAFTGDGSWNLPVPATFVLDRDGIVRGRHVDADYTRRMEPDAVIGVLRAL